MTYVASMKKKKVDKTHPPGWVKPKHPGRSAQEVRDYAKVLSGYLADMQLVLERAAKRLESIDDEPATITASTAGIESALRDAFELVEKQFGDKSEKEFIKYEARKKVRELRAKS